MSDDPGSIFREEALRHRGGPSGPGDVVRIAPRWTAFAYWALLALVVAGLASTFAFRVTKVASGPAVVRGTEMVSVVPAGFASDLRPGKAIELRIPGHGPLALTIRSVGPEAADAQAAGRLLGLDLTSAGLAPGPLLVVRATAPSGIAEGSSGTVSVRIGSDRLIVTLLPGLRSLIGGRDG